MYKRQVVNNAAGLISGSTSIPSDLLTNLEATLQGMDIGPLLGLWLQSFIVQLTAVVLNIVIFVIVYGRMIEIYLLTSLAPIPFATVGNREIGHVGHNYFKSLLAIAFQGFLILVCIAIYAVLVQGISTAGATDIMGAVWQVMGYTVLLCFTLFKTGTLAVSYTHLSTYNFIVALAFSQMFNLLCERADNKYGGRLPHHVRVLWDEAANTGQVPQLEKDVYKRQLFGWP